MIPKNTDRPRVFGFLSLEQGNIKNSVGEAQLMFLFLLITMKQPLMEDHIAHDNKIKINEIQK